MQWPSNIYHTAAGRRNRSECCAPRPELFALQDVKTNAEPSTTQTGTMASDHAGYRKPFASVPQHRRSLTQVSQKLPWARMKASRLSGFSSSKHVIADDICGLPTGLPRLTLPLELLLRLAVRDSRVLQTCQGVMSAPDCIILAAN